MRVPSGQVHADGDRPDDPRCGRRPSHGGEGQPTAIARRPHGTVRRSRSPDPAGARDPDARQPDRAAYLGGLDRTGRYTAWPGLRQAVRVERCVTDKRTGETRTESAYAITS